MEGEEGKTFACPQGKEFLYPLSGGEGEGGGVGSVVSSTCVTFQHSHILYFLLLKENVKNIFIL